MIVNHQTRSYPRVASTRKCQGRNSGFSWFFPFFFCFVCFCGDDFHHPLSFSPSAAVLDRANETDEPYKKWTSNHISERKQREERQNLTDRKFFPQKRGQQQQAKKNQMKWIVIEIKSAMWDGESKPKLKLSKLYDLSHSIYRFSTKSSIDTKVEKHSNMLERKRNLYLSQKKKCWADKSKIFEKIWEFW